MDGLAAGVKVSANVPTNARYSTRPGIRGGGTKCQTTQLTNHADITTSQILCRMLPHS